MLTTQCDICNYADDNSLHAIDSDLTVVKSKLTSDFQTFNSWSLKNYMVLNEGKFYFMALGNRVKHKNFKFKNTNLRGKEKQKLQRLTIDRKLTFDYYINSICKVVS